MALSTPLNASMQSPLKLIKDTPYHLLRVLEEACAWAKVSRGRCLQYERLFKELVFNDKHSREHWFSYNELMIIVEIFELWRGFIEDFPGLEQNIARVFRKGPVLPEDESPDNSSNRSRNDAFPILLAGKFIRAGVSVESIEGFTRKGIKQAGKGVMEISPSPDILVSCGGTLLRVECKRPMSASAVAHNTCSAINQVGESSTPGIIAIDSSLAIRPKETVLGSYSSVHKAENFLNQKLMKEIKPAVQEELTPIIAGAILYGRVPAHTVIAESKIVGPNGQPFLTYRRDSISTFNFIGNRVSPYFNEFQQLYDALN